MHAQTCVHVYSCVQTHIILSHGETRRSNNGCLRPREAENMAVFSDQDPEQLTVSVQSFRPGSSPVKG